MYSLGHELCNQCHNTHCTDLNHCDMEACEHCHIRLHACKLGDHLGVCGEAVVECVVGACGGGGGCGVRVARNAMAAHMRECRANVVFMFLPDLELRASRAGGRHHHAHAESPEVGGKTPPLDAEHAFAAYHRALTNPNPNPSPQGGVVNAGWGVREVNTPVYHFWTHASPFGVVRLAHTFVRREQFDAASVAVSHYASGVLPMCVQRCPMAYAGCPFALMTQQPIAHHALHFDPHTAQFNMHPLSSFSPHNNHDHGQDHDHGHEGEGVGWLCRLPQELLEKVLCGVDGASLLALSLTSATMRRRCAPELSRRACVVREWRKPEEGEEGWVLEGAREVVGWWAGSTVLDFSPPDPPVPGFVVVPVVPDHCNSLTMQEHMAHCPLVVGDRVQHRAEVWDAFVRQLPANP